MQLKKKEMDLKKHYRKLKYYKIWMIMKEIKLLMHYKGNHTMKENISLKKEKAEIFSISLKKEMLLLLKKIRIMDRMMLFMNINPETISEN